MDWSLASYMAEIGSLGAVCWAATEGVGKLLRWPKPLIAAAAGPSASLAAYGAGFLSTPVGGLRGAAMAAVSGILVTVAAGAAHDYVINPVLKSLPGRE